MNDREVGAPPYPGPWPDNPKYDHVLLREGDKRNVIDKYRYWKVSAIKGDLDKNRVPLQVAIENFQNDFNIGTIVRNANAFNVQAVHIIGRRHWNRRGAMVTDAYMNVFYHKSVTDFTQVMRKENLKIIAIDITDKSKPLSAFHLPKNAVLVFGGEGPGISRDLLEEADDIVMVEQLGSTRSVNVGVASGIAMYEWSKTHVL